MGEDIPYPKGSAGKPVALEARSEAGDGRRFSPSIGRNKDDVRRVFLEHMVASGHVLEIASGTGEHGAHITAAADGLVWTYTDFDRQSLSSQAAWATHLGQDRLRGPYQLDASANDWGEAETPRPNVIFCANMIHIAPFNVARGLFAGAGRLLADGGAVFLYGPFARDGEITPSNQRFSEDLKRRDPDWGVRDLEREVVPLGKAHGLALAKVIEMPANNLSVIFRRS